MTYQDPGTNPVTDTDEDKVSTFAMDVDTASYSIAQRYVADGNTPDPASVRVEEWVNAFDQGYPAPEDATFGVHIDGAPSPFLAERDVLLRVGIQARDSSERTRPAAALTFVIDTSGSMAREDRLELVKDSLRQLVRGLGRGDSIAVVTFGDDARVVLPPTQATDDDRILAAIDELQPGGSTNLEAGLTLGYQLARETLLGGDGIDRVILASDGVANVGLTDADGILRRIRDDAAAGIELVSVGVGMGNYNDTLLEQLADQGDGFYAYVNDRARGPPAVHRRPRLDAPDRRARRQGAGRVRSRPGRRRTGSSATRTGPSPTTTSAIRASTPAPSGPAMRSPPCTTSRSARGSSREAVLGTVRLRWTEPGASHESVAPERDPGRRPGAAVRGGRSDLPARRDRGGRGRGAAARTAARTRRTCGAILDVAHEGGDLPATDQVHDFLRFLEQMDELGG